MLMSKTSQSPPGLPADIARPLAAACARVAELKPWEFMSDLHAVGVRDGPTGALHVASVLGTLRQVFGIIFYRGPLGLAYIHKMVTEPGTPDPEVVIEALDYMQVEWTTKSELRRTDRETLANASLQPASSGKVWPKFTSCEPGWFPWFPRASEAKRLTGFIEKVNRFARLFKRATNLYEDHPAGEVPIIPAGPEDTLQPAEIQWLPLVLAPVPLPEPLVLSAQERSALQALPARPGCTFELLAKLTPEMPVFDEEARRPACGRIGLLCDSDSRYVLAVKFVHGAAPLREAARNAFVNGLLKAQIRPVCIRVESEKLLEVIRPASEAIGVGLELAESLPAASDVLAHLVDFRSRR